jgi:hypothetical protein
MSKMTKRYFKVVEPTGQYTSVTEASLKDTEGWTQDIRVIWEDWQTALAMGFRPSLDIKTLEEERFKFDAAQSMVHEDGIYWPDDSEEHA